MKTTFRPSPGMILQGPRGIVLQSLQNWRDMGIVPTNGRKYMVSFPGGENFTPISVESWAWYAAAL